MVNKTVSETTRNAVWNELLDSARAVRYYDTLSSQYRRKHRIIMVILAASAASGVAALLEWLPDKVQIVANAVVAIAAVWGLFSDHARKAAVLHSVSLQCSRLHDEYKSLWLDVENYTKDDEEIRHILKRLNAEGDRATGVVGYADISVDEKVNDKSTDDADEVLKDQYTVSA